MSRKDTTLQPLSSNEVSAKELARSLGLVKKRPSSSTSRTKCQEKEIKPSQYFAYLIVLDFESTCWKDKKMNYGPEIIEFPAVLLNTSTGEVESEFHMFVQPSEHRRLSEFCTELTGITQDITLLDAEDAAPLTVVLEVQNLDDSSMLKAKYRCCGQTPHVQIWIAAEDSCQTQVDEGVPVGTCLMLFGRWLQEMRLKKGFKFPCDQILNKDENESTESLTKWCTFVTWSDWDLGTCLKNECYRKQLRVPHPLRSWIDLRATYKNFYSRKPQGLAGALQDLGIQFTGREHSGLDDARNTARLAWRMVSDGCVMQITKSTDGAVEKLWNIVLKRPGHSQNNLRAVGTGASHTSSHNKTVWASEDAHSLHNKPDIKPSKIRCTKETSVNESLNFGNAQRENHGRHSTRQNVTVKREIAGPRDDQIPGNRMTNVREKSVVWGAVESRDNSKENGPVKRRASESSVSESIAGVNCDGACATPNTTKSLITPTTSLSSLNKRARGCCNGLFKSEMRCFLTQGILVKRGLEKQTLSYYQHTPLGSRDQGVTLGMREKDNTASKQPCKASNIEPKGVTTPLFRLPTNQGLLAERHPVEGLKNDKFITASNYTGTTANKPLAKAMTVTTTPSSIHLNKPCTTPIRKSISFNPPPHGNIKTNSPITSPVACFNGGGITPPLCHCGRRTRRRSVINPGPNQGRAFFTCSLSHGRSSFGVNVDKKKFKIGCKFFRWEVRL